MGPSGSGKTHWIRKRILQWTQEDEARAVCVFSITEAFSLEAVSQKLQRTILKEGSSTQLALCFHLNMGKFRTHEMHEWKALMEKINRFFFSLLVLRSVEDSTGFVFNVPPGSRWEVIVEIPDRIGHLDEAPADTLSQDDGLWKELPVLASIGTLQRPADAFDLDGENTRLVCKYLKSYQDGTIDELYTSNGGGYGGPKDVLFVLDASGSMAGAPFETCRRCLLELCRGKLQPVDRVGVVVFNGRILLNVQPAPLSARHLANIETQLVRVQPSGGTDLWGAMLDAADLLCSLPDRNPSWMVSLTDGLSANENLLACTERLRKLDASNINVLSITINLQDSSRDLIRRVCVDGRIGTNEIVPADGGLEAIEEAWAVVGEAMTVSERVELAEVTDAECHALLSHYMLLPQKRWSMLKQSYWVRYLARRCHILRTSEKFNMNDGFERFGSSTLKIMMEEAHHALSDEYRHDWDAINHEQFVY